MVPLAIRDRGEILFGVTTMTIAAVVTTYVFGLLYFAATGTYLFFDSYIPIAVFLGMHLLLTDPATSPRSESGRILFGILYGLGTIAAVGLLRTIDAPAFYDKLLPVPILNLVVQVIDRAARSGALRPLDLSRIGQRLTAAQRRTAFVGIWLATFAGIRAANGVGDDHPGQWVPFWQETCEQGSDRACEHLAVLQQNLCEAGSGWSCNELAIQLAANELDRSEALTTLGRGCALQFPAACENLERIWVGATPLARAPPLPAELPILLRGSKGPVQERDTHVLQKLACERGWSNTCG